MIYSLLLHLYHAPPPTQTPPPHHPTAAAAGELLRVNFNVSFPHLPCEHATLDISDAMGLKRLNLTKTVRKTPVDGATLARAGRAERDEARPEPQYDDEEQHPGEAYEDADFATPLSKASWDAHMRHYDIVVVNFYAPWCPWCQRLGPTWEAVTEGVHARYPEADGRIRFAKVDCTVEAALCAEHAIAAFPSIRIFHHGSDDVEKLGQHEHLAYFGDRTTEALAALADSLAAAAGPPHRLPGVAAAAASTGGLGCNFAGFVLVKKVPGTLHFTARAPGHTVDYEAMRLSHTVHHLYFGSLPSPRRRAALAKLHPGGLTDDWADKLRGRAFASPSPGATYEHYSQVRLKRVFSLLMPVVILLLTTNTNYYSYQRCAQVVLTSIEPRAAALRFDAYEYTVQSHAYDAPDHASVKFTHRMSPVQIVVAEKEKRLGRFLVSVCAVIGGIFTVAGIVDATVHTVNRAAKKRDIGKLG